MAEKEKPPAVEIPLSQAGALFAADLEPERVEVPEGLLLPGSWVELRPMDGYAYERYLESGQTISVSGTDAATATTDIRIDTADQHLRLLMATITGWCIVLRKQAKNDPGSWVEEQMAMPAHWRAGTGPSSGRVNAEREFAEFLRRLKRPLWEWLVRECQRVNGLDVVTLGN